MAWRFFNSGTCAMWPRRYVPRRVCRPGLYRRSAWVLPSHGVAAGRNPSSRRPLPHHRRSFMNFQPLADRILVRRIEEQETVRGGIIIPDTAKEKPQEGEIVAIGPGRLTEEGKRITLEVKKGDRVLVGKYSGTDVKIDGTEYVI